MAGLAEPPISMAAETLEIVMTRMIDAPRALVWKAWTDPAHIVRWWGGVDCRATDASVDLRVGGAFRLGLFIPDGSMVPCSGVFRDIVHPERLVIDGDVGDTGERTPCGGGLPPGARVTVRFEEAGDQTKLTIVTRFPTGAALAAALDSGYDVGWPACLDRLTNYVRGFEI